MHKNSNQFESVIQEIWKVNNILVLIMSDIFTKGLSSPRFIQLKNKLMLTYIPISFRGDVNITDDTCTTQQVDTHKTVKIVAAAELN